MATKITHPPQACSGGIIISTYNEEMILFLSHYSGKKTKTVMGIHIGKL
jgi:hypothetical protein